MKYKDIRIRRAGGGYIVTKDYSEKVYSSLEDALNYLLTVFEGRASTFKGGSFGEVIINRIAHSKAVEPQPLNDMADDIANKIRAISKAENSESGSANY